VQDGRASDARNLDETDMADLPRRRFGQEQVLVLERSAKDGARVVALRSRARSCPGPSGGAEFSRAPR
jgi:hypothetical protein